MKKLLLILMFFCVGIYFVSQNSGGGKRSIASKQRDLFANRRLPNFSPCVYNFNCESNFCVSKKCEKRPYDLPSGNAGDACYGDHQNCLSEFCYSGFCLGSEKQKALPGQLCIGNSECSSNFCNNYICAAKPGELNKVGEPCQISAHCLSRYCNQKFNLCAGSMNHMAKTGEFCGSPLECESGYCFQNRCQ